MALEDINPGTGYRWYSAAYDKLDKTVGISDNDFGQGRENTEYVNNKWNDPSLPWGKHNANGTDMWEVIQEEIADGWFVPSKSEWSAFGAAFEITASNYSSTYGLLSNSYWSSSQRTTCYVFVVSFLSGNIGINTVERFNFFVRLATTF